MSLQFSTAYRNNAAAAALGEAPSGAIMSGCVLMLYAGSRPADADASIGSATLLATYSVDDSGDSLVWESPVNGSVSKPAGVVWSGVAVNSGTASFFRYQSSDDDGSASSTNVRIQGKVGLVTDQGSDLALSSLAVASGATLTIDAASATVPSSL